jgi:hypothetical protein
MNAQARLDLQTNVVECGGALVGTVSWTGNVRHSGLAVVLRFRTQGRGDVDSAEAARFDLGSGEAGEARFQLDVPAVGPVTYNGQLLRVLWQVAVTTSGKRKFTSGADSTAVELTVVPRGWPPPTPEWGSPGGPR